MKLFNWKNNKLKQSKDSGALKVGDRLLINGCVKTIIDVDTIYTFGSTDIFGMTDYTLSKLERTGYKVIDSPIVKIDNKTFKLNDKLAKAIEEAESF